MRQFRITRWPEAVFRPFGFGALMALLVMLLASCSTGSGVTDVGGTEPKGKTVPPVAYQQITGLPPGKLNELKTALAVAGGTRDIGFVEGAAPAGAFTLGGQFRAFADASGVRVIYQWQFRDADGVLIDTLDGEDNAGLFSGTDPWAAVSPSVIERIARRTTEQMAKKLSGMGYATRLSRLYVPPADYFALASPDAHREVDFETLNGPGMASAGMDMIASAGDMPPAEALADLEPSVTSVDPQPGEALLATTAAPPPPSDTEVAVEEVSSGSTRAKTADAGASTAERKSDLGEPAPKASEKQAKSSREIRAVAVLAVKGSPGSGGDAELTAAMRKTLSAAGWPVVSKPQADALTIVGRVKVAEKGSGQSVSVRWEVRSPDGETLGDVKQANDVPRGALDLGWGPAAFAVAEAAATGIFDIVKRYQ